MATLKNLSAQLGLSVTQVSRALNGYSDVSEATRERVLQMAKELNYQPNVLARKLARGRSGMVAVVRRHFPEISQDSMFVDVVTGLSLEFSTRDMQLVLHVAPRDNDIIELHKKLYAGGAIDGFVLLEPHVNDPRIDYLQANDIPFVMHGRTEDTPDYPFVDIDNVAVGYELTKHLLDLGHRKILLLNGFADRGYNLHRERGYRQAHEQAGIKITDSYVQNARMNESFGQSIAEEFFGRDDAPTAVVCGHLRIASGLLQQLDIMGLRTPEDVSVVAHDDELTSMNIQDVRDGLTVSRAAIRNSWKPLSEFMDLAVRGEPSENLQEIQEIELLIGTSTAAPPSIIS